MSLSRAYIGQIVVPSPTLRTWPRRPKFGHLKCLQALAAEESQCSWLVMDRWEVNRRALYPGVVTWEAWNT